MANSSCPRLARIVTILETGKTQRCIACPFCHLFYSAASKGRHKPAHPNCANCQFAQISPEGGAQGGGGAAAAAISERSDLHGIEMYNSLMGMSQDSSVQGTSSTRESWWTRQRFRSRIAGLEMTGTFPPIRTCAATLLFWLTLQSLQIHSLQFFRVCMCRPRRIQKGNLS